VINKTLQEFSGLANYCHHKRFYKPVFLHKKTGKLRRNDRFNTAKVISLIYQKRVAARPLT